MPNLYVLVGVPGSGKSTWVQNQLWSKDCAIISTDDYVSAYARSVNKTYSEVFDFFMPEAVKLMTAAVLDAKEKQKDIIWDQTSTTINSRLKKLRMLPEYYSIAIVFNTPSTKELRKRLANRPGKNIPWEVVSNMIRSFELPTEEENFKEIWYV